MLGPLRGPGCVEEPHNHGNQPIGAIHECEMSGAREHSELYMREADVIAGDAAAVQTKQLDQMLGPDNIRFPSDKQLRYIVCRNSLIRQSIKRSIQRLM